MQWSELFDAENEPQDSQVKEFVNSPLWDGLDGHLRQEYNVKPKLAYSNCAMDAGLWKGWNVKYKKSGKSLCTVYPKQGYLLVLLQVGLREMNETELLMPTCTEYTQNLFNQAVVGHIGKFLAFDVQDENVLDDIKKLIAVRAKLMTAKKL